MFAPRFYVPNLVQQGQVELTATDAQHASNVLRLGVGAEVELFDGLGGACRAEIVTSARRRVVVEILQPLANSPSKIARLELMVALPKGDRQRTLVEGLTQLGVHRLTPLVSERSVAQPNPNALDRLRKATIEACKQCRRNRLMEIGEPLAFAALMQLGEDSCLRAFAHPYGVPQSVGSIELANEPVHQDEKDRSCNRCVIGPEGGLTDSEAEQLREAGWTQLSLGENILRVEVAAQALAAALLL